MSAENSRPVVDCTTLHARKEGYPFGEMIPRRIRIIKTVAADPMPAIGFAKMGDTIPVAIYGMELDGWTNSYGAVAAVFPDGRKLGVKPGESLAMR